MNAEIAPSEGTAAAARRKRSAAWPVAAIVLLLVAAWCAAFSVTGLLWWHAPAGAGAHLPRPSPPIIEAVDADWVNLHLYYQSHPQWQP